MELRPNRGSFLRPFGCGWFIREFLLGKGPEGSRVIDPLYGATQSDINYEYKEALARATAREHAERVISDMVVSGVDVSEEQAEKIYQRELRRVSRKFTHMRYHSFLMYFGVLKRLGWVEITNKTEPSAIQDNYPSAPGRVYYRLTREGIEATEELWSNPLFTLTQKSAPATSRNRPSRQKTTEAASHAASLLPPVPIPWIAHLFKSLNAPFLSVFQRPDSYAHGGR